MSARSRYITPQEMGLREVLEKIARIAATRGTPEGDRVVLDGIARLANAVLKRT
jgi:hypothetical protein